MLYRKNVGVMISLATKRILEIDFFRTLALFLMILYHFIYDLDEWTSIPIDVDSVIWFSIGKLAALLFIFLSGISSGLSKHPVQNGIRLLFWGLVISLVTRIVMPGQYVRFGILHFLGTMMLIYPLLRKRSNTFLFILTISSVGLGFFFSTQILTNAGLLPFGLTYSGFTTIDYYPLFPYSAATFLGILFYRFRYIVNDSILYSQKINFLNDFPNASIFEKLSRHSLMIYLIHQPVLLLFILGFQYILK